MKHPIQKGAALITVCGLLLALLSGCGGEASAANGSTAAANNEPVHLAEAADLFQIAENPAGTYILDDDIKLDVYSFADWEKSESELNTRYWTPVGTADAPFTGTIDGGGHTITLDETLDPAGCDSLGLLGYNAGTVKNLSVNWYLRATGKHIAVEYYVGCEPTLQYVGTIAGYNSGTIDGCSAQDVGVTAQSSTLTGTMLYSGGIAGYNAGTITNCTVASNRFAAADAPTLEVAVGGIAGGQAAGATLSGCKLTHFADIGATEATCNFAGAYVGGIVGILAPDATITDCIVTLEEEGKEDEKNCNISAFTRSGASNQAAGGAVGWAQGNLNLSGITVEGFTECSSQPKTEPTEWDDSRWLAAGCIAGRVDGSAVLDSCNVCVEGQGYTDIKSENCGAPCYAGGVLGYVGGDVTLTNIQTASSANSEAYVGGNVYAALFTGYCGGRMTVDENTNCHLENCGILLATAKGDAYAAIMVGRTEGGIQVAEVANGNYTQVSVWPTVVDGTLYTNSEAAGFDATA